MRAQHRRHSHKICTYPGYDLRTGFTSYGGIGLAVHRYQIAQGSQLSPDLSLEEVIRTHPHPNAFFIIIAKTVLIVTMNQRSPTPCQRFEVGDVDSSIVRRQIPPKD